MFAATHAHRFKTILLIGLLLSPARLPAQAPQTPQTPAPPVPISAASKSSLRGLLAKQPARFRKAAARFYEERADALAWTADGKPTPQARALATMLRDADAKGLAPDDYGGPLWTTRLTQLDSVPAGEYALLQLDVGLTGAVLRYLSDLARGRVEPRAVDAEFDDKGKPAEIDAGLRALVSSGDLAAAVQAIEPPFPAYQRLEQALQVYLALARQDDGARPKPPKKSLAPGAPYPDAQRLAQLLRLVGDLPKDAAIDDTYGPALVEAVKRFQARNGLATDGRLTATTWKQLDRPLSDRVLQLQLSLERMRWLPRAFHEPPLVINIPEFRLHADDAQFHWTMSMEVVVGRAYHHRTPAFASQIQQVIFQPFWNVPANIAKKELEPELTAHPERWTSLGYELIGKSGEAVDGPFTEETRRSLAAGELRIRQKPGPRNALGRVKFVFPNDHQVYLHDTPTPAAFDKARRDFSHGCIRVQDPEKLAAWVLRDQPAWTPERVHDAMAGGEQLEVPLARPIPVLILYGTATVMEDGEVHFFQDIYGYDAELAQALAKQRAASSR